MVTGDNIVTASKVAIDVGIATREELEKENVCLEGNEVTDSSTIASSLKVAARCTPE